MLVALKTLRCLRRRAFRLLLLGIAAVTQEVDFIEVVALLEDLHRGDVLVFAHDLRVLGG